MSISILILYFRENFSNNLDEEAINRLKLIIDTRVRIRVQKNKKYIPYQQAKAMKSENVLLEFLHHISIPNEIIELSQTVSNRVCKMFSKQKYFFKYLVCQK